jgi:hypothetical protein
LISEGAVNPPLSLYKNNNLQEGKGNMKRFKINGKEYVTKELDFNAVCDLEEMGVNITNIEKNALTVVRGYVAFCGNMNVEEAGKEIQAHVLSGGGLDEVIEIVNEQMTSSDFFRSLNERAEEKTQ